MRKITRSFTHTSPGKCIYLIVYVDDIVITGNDIVDISQLKEHLCRHFQTKDLGSLKYFLGIEVAQSKYGVVISQRKYALDILHENGMIDCKLVENPMDPNQKLTSEEGELFSLKIQEADRKTNLSHYYKARSILCSWSG